MSHEDMVIRDPEGGSNQSGLRDQNARLVLSFLSRHGAMPSAEIARRSGLSAQTVSNIVRALEADGILIRGAAIKGKVGKPSVPMALNPTGVYSLGLSIGRRSAELVLIDFNGHQIDAETISYPFPSIETVFAFLKSALQTLSNRNSAAIQLVTGIGVARPNRIWDWLENARAPESAMMKWRQLDLSCAVAEATDYEVFVENDATSACVAEHLLGRGREFHDFAYIYVGSFVGGGLVLGGKIVPGRSHSTATLGPLPVPGEDGKAVQLLSVASLYTLEEALDASPEFIRKFRDDQSDWHEFENVLAPWIDKTAKNLAWAAASIASVVDIEAVIIDGAMPENVRARLVAATSNAYDNFNTTGIEGLRFEEAVVGRRARSIGAALLPINARYFPA